MRKRSTYILEIQFASGAHSQFTFFKLEDAEVSAKTLADHYQVQKTKVIKDEGALFSSPLTIEYINGFIRGLTMAE